MSKPTIGRSLPRKEGRDKVTGAAQYLDDLPFEGALYGAVVRSTSPRGRIKAIHFEGDLPWDEFVIVRGEDIPGENRQALIEKDQPCLATDVVNHADEPVLLIAHPDRHLVQRARSAVRIELEALPTVMSIEESLARDTVIWGEDNIQKAYSVLKGDPDSVWESAHKIIEGSYSTGAQEQLYIEPQGMVAKAGADGVTVWGSLQCPYYVQQALEVVFGFPSEKVRVIHAVTGGGFGGKEEYPSILACHAALLAYKAGKPVKLIYDRAEDMAVTTKRHPSRTLHKTAVDAEGRILALDIDFVLDGGAYATLSSVVLSRGTLHAAGPYAVPNIRIEAKVVATNTPPYGAFRGFGAPQSCFAIERHMDLIAKELGLSPEELRRRNFVSEGKTTATGQIIREAVDLPGLLERAFRESDFEAKRARFAKENPGSRIRRGIGFTTFFHGAGFTGSGETYLKSRVGAETTAAGGLSILAASTEIGQGSNTVFSQIAADALGLEYDMVEVARPDTHRVPDSGPTVASRTTMVVGKLVAEAAKALRTKLVELGRLAADGGPEDFIAAAKAQHEEAGVLRVYSEYVQPPNIVWDEKTYRGDAYGTYAWAVYVAEVEVDTLSYVAEVKDFVAVQEVGRVINPIMAAGQIEGGVAQGVGFAIYEKVRWQDGRMINNQMTNYIMPTAADVPTIRVFFEEHPYAYGGGGAKGIGELPLDGSAPAVIAAIESAVGVSPTRIPLLPEDLMELMEADRG